MGKDVADAKLESLYRDCRDLARYIARARSEVAAMRPQQLQQERLPRAGQELDAIVKETEAATQDIMTAAEAIMAAKTEDTARYKTVVEAHCLSIFESCSFQDITGQRIRKVVQTLTHIEERLGALQRIWGADLADAEPGSDDVPTGDAALLHGPQLKGQGIDQSAVDAMFADAPAPTKTPAQAPAKAPAAAKPAPRVAGKGK